MKKLLLIVLVLIVVLIGALALAPFLIPVETYKEQVAAQVERATGRTLAIDGPVSVSILPTLALEAEDVRFANVPGAANPDMVALKQLQVELEIWPLLTGSVEVDRFVLVEPVIHLEVDASGRPNWQFGEAAGAEAPAEPAEPTTDGGAPSIPLADLKLGDIRLQNGTLTYTDATSGTSERIEAIDMSLDLPDLRSRLSADGSLRYKGETVALDLAVETPLALIQDGASNVTAAVQAPTAELTFDGLVRSAPVAGVEGGVDLSVSAIRELVAWLVEPLEFAGEGLNTLAIAGRLEASPERVAFTEAAIDLDAIESTGDLVVDLRGAVPRLSGRLDVGDLDVNPYLPPEAPEPAPEPGAEGEDAGDAGPQDWSDEPIAIPPIGGLELDFQLTADSLRYDQLELGRTVLNLALEGNVFTADLTEFALYGGQGNGRLRVAVENGTPVISESFRLDGLDARPFLEAAADLERLEGTASLDLDVETRGSTERQLVENLNGDGSATFRDGAIVGINLAAMVRNVASAFLDPEAGEARKTDFAELGGTFTIRDGVVTNDDMRLQAPVLRMDGSGRIDLPARTLSYRIEPKAAATLEGQGGREEVSGILVPVIIEGPWDDLSYRPDLSGVLESALQDPEAIRQRLEQLGESPEAIRRVIEQVETEEQAEQLLERLQTPEGAQSVVEQLQEQGPQGVIRGLLGGGGGGSEEQPQSTEGETGGAQETPSDPAQRLLKGLFGN